MQDAPASPRCQSWLERLIRQRQGEQFLITIARITVFHVGAVAAGVTSLLWIYLCIENAVNGLEISETTSNFIVNLKNPIGLSLFFVIFSSLGFTAGLQVMAWHLSAVHAKRWPLLDYVRSFAFVPMCLGLGVVFSVGRQLTNEALYFGYVVLQFLVHGLGAMIFEIKDIAGTGFQRVLVGILHGLVYAVISTVNNYAMCWSIRLGEILTPEIGLVVKTLALTAVRGSLGLIMSWYISKEVLTGVGTVEGKISHSLSELSMKRVAPEPETRDPETANAETENSVARSSDDNAEMDKVAAMEGRPSDDVTETAAIEKRADGNCFMSYMASMSMYMPSFAVAPLISIMFTPQRNSTAFYVSITTCAFTEVLYTVSSHTLMKMMRMMLSLKRRSHADVEAKKKNLPNLYDKLQDDDEHIHVHHARLVVILFDRIGYYIAIISACVFTVLFISDDLHLQPIAPGQGSGYKELPYAITLVRCAIWIALQLAMDVAVITWLMWFESLSWEAAKYVLRLPLVCLSRLSPTFLAFTSTVTMIMYIRGLAGNGFLLDQQIGNY